MCFLGFSDRAFIPGLRAVCLCRSIQLVRLWHEIRLGLVGHGAKDVLRLGKREFLSWR